MLHWFPTPYPDELLYSVFARYHLRSGNTSPKITIEELFEKRTVRSVWDLPANLNILLSQLGSYWHADQLILNHTMYPYYAAFLLPKQAKQVKQSMLDCKGSTIHTRIGLAASNLKAKTNLWVCSDCINEDMDNYGETYWRRVHQAPGVFICPKHETLLEETIVSVKAQNQHEFIIANPLLTEQRPNLNLKSAMEMFTSYQWPGNIRELRNVVERMIIFIDHSSINAEDIMNIFPVTINENIAKEGLAQEKALLEKERIREVLVETYGNKSAAAKKLGISRVSLYDKLKQYNIKV
jgi:DNA-binding protein Fis